MEKNLSVDSNFYGFFFSDLPDTSGNLGVDKHLRIEVNTIVPFRILNDFEGKIAILLVRRVDLHKYEIIDLNGKCSFVAHYQGQNNWRNFSYNFQSLPRSRPII